MRVDASLKRSAPVFAALGDELRLSLVARLGHEGPLSITTLTEGTSVTRQAVTKHLRVLSDAGLVRASKRGREQRWEVKTAPLGEARRCLELVARQWDSALARLRQALEQDE